VIAMGLLWVLLGQLEAQVPPACVWVRTHMDNETKRYDTIANTTLQLLHHRLDPLAVLVITAPSWPDACPASQTWQAELSFDGKFLVLSVKDPNQTLDVRRQIRLQRRANFDVAHTAALAVLEGLEPSLERLADLVPEAERLAMEPAVERLTDLDDLPMPVTPPPEAAPGITSRVGLLAIAGASWPRLRAPSGLGLMLRLDGFGLATELSVSGYWPTSITGSDHTLHVQTGTAALSVLTHLSEAPLPWDLGLIFATRGLWQRQRGTDITNEQNFYATVGAGMQVGVGLVTHNNLSVQLALSVVRFTPRVRFELDGRPLFNSGMLEGTLRVAISWQSIDP